jgi:uncharacterized damage-inducible protein DinB
MLKPHFGPENKQGTDDETGGKAQAMSSVPHWFDRKFDFTFPIENYPNLRMRLWGSPCRLEELVRGVPHHLMIEKAAGKWSAQEHAGHLADLEPLWLVRVEDFLTEVGTLALADLTNRKTEAANHNARTLEEVLAEFRDARRRLLDRVGQLSPPAFRGTKLHPRLKQPMRLVDHLYFVAEHDDHHLAKIWEIVEETDRKPTTQVIP